MAIYPHAQHSTINLQTDLSFGIILAIVRSCYSLKNLSLYRIVLPVSEHIPR